MRKEFNPLAIFLYTNMAAAMVLYTNMAARDVMWNDGHVRENILLVVFVVIRPQINGFFGEQN